jgi:nucleotide-binding universal stress UspA family protein
MLINQAINDTTLGNPMKSILVPVEPGPLLESVLQSAWLLGSAFGSYIEGFALSPVLTPFLGADAIGGTVVYDADLRQDEKTAEESRRSFEKGISERTGSAAAGMTFGWLKDAAQGDGFVGAYGRVFDVTVLGRPSGAAEGPRMSTFEAALFESGRPVLIAPPSPPAKMGEHVAIAWNRSAETARTVAFAMPLLERAKRITLFAIRGGSVAGPDGAQLAANLRRHGLKPEIVAIDKEDGRSIGIAVLEQAAKLDADLIIKGGFTQSRLSQLIFGGATRHILAETTLPVFMAH